MDRRFWATTALNVVITPGELVGGLLAGFSLIKLRSKEWCHRKFTAKIGSITLISLLFTIVVMVHSQTLCAPCACNPLIY